VPIADLWFKYGSIVRLFEEELVEEVSYYLISRAQDADDPAIALLRHWILDNFTETG